MRILGIDPGTSVTGIGLIELHGSDVSLVHFDSFQLRSALPLTERLKKIYDECMKCIDEYRPDMLAVETAFYGKNIQSTLKLGQARGVAIIAALNSGLYVFEYSPREVKKSVTGNGASSKHHVQCMVKAILGIEEEIGDYDSTDALAVALCHAFSRENKFAARKNGKAGSWQAYIDMNPGKVIKPVRK